MRKLADLLRDETAATAIEYAIIASLISIAAIAGMTLLGKTMGNTYNKVSANVSAASR